MGFSIFFRKGVWKLRDRTYEEVLDMIEAYGYERILEDFQTDKVNALMILDELGYVDLEVYEDD